MLIDRTHVKWAIGTSVATVVTGVHYAHYVSRSPNGPSGGSLEGLIYGTLAALIMLFAALLSARRKVPGWRIGSAQAWLRAHIWLTLLSVPWVLFHGGFRMGGPLTFWLMSIYIIIIASGIAGLMIQQFMPQRMSLRIPREMVRDEIERILEANRQEARVRYDAVMSRLEASVAGKEAIRPLEGRAPLEAFYREVVAPYLEGRMDDQKLDADWCRGRVEEVKTLISPELDETVESFADLCEERRQLLLQKQMHGLLHGWLYVHVPLSMVVMVILLVHIVQALKYTRLEAFF